MKQLKYLMMIALFWFVPTAWAQAPDETQSAPVQAAPADLQPCPDHDDCPRDGIIQCGCDPQGRLTRVEWRSAETGALERRITYTHDDHGNRQQGVHELFREEQAVIRTTVIYDAQGNTLRRERDIDVDGVADEVNAYTYDSQGHLRTADLDGARFGRADGTIDLRETYYYDDRGHLTCQEWDYYANDTVDRRARYSFDAEGFLVSQQMDENADGTPEEECTFNPPCPEPFMNCIGRTCQQREGTPAQPTIPPP